MHYISLIDIIYAYNKSIWILYVAFKHKLLSQSHILTLVARVMVRVRRTIWKQCLVVTPWVCVKIDATIVICSTSRVGNKWVSN